MSGANIIKYGHSKPSTSKRTTLRYKNSAVGGDMNYKKNCFMKKIFILQSELSNKYCYLKPIL